MVKASLPEVNQFTGNCFRVVRIVLKITFLGLRYPGQRPECPSLSYYGSCPELLESTRPVQWYITTPWQTMICLSLLRSQNVSDTLQGLVTATPRNF